LTVGVTVSREAGNRDDRPLILIFSTYYWPELAGNAPYVTGLAEHIAARGWDTHVACGFPHYPSWEAAPRRPAERSSRAGVQIHRRWHYVPAKQTALRRVVYEGSLLASGMTALRSTRRPDVILGISPSLSGAALASVASRVHRRPHGLLFQDLMGQAAAQSGVRGGGAVSRMTRAAEWRFARGAQSVAVVSKGFRPYLEEGGVDPGRIVEVRNWSQRSAPSRSREETRALLGWDEGTFVCVHAGNMGHKQDLGNVVRTAPLVDGRAHLVLAGDGNERAALQQLASTFATANLEFLPPAAPGDYESILDAADLLVVNQRGAVSNMSLASKLTAYFSSGTPVVAACAAHSDTARLISEAGAGVVVAPDDPSALAAAILALREDESGRASLGERGRAYASEFMSEAAAFRDLDGFLDGLLSQREP
jgi:colanic acid biosynthesis glycosyl transferase WcaI